MVLRELLVQDSLRLELVPEFHDELVEQGVGCSFVIFVVGQGSGCDAVQSHPAVALANVVLKRDRGLVSLGDPASNRPRIEVDKILGDAALVEPQISEVHLTAVELRVFGLPAVDVKSDQPHLIKFTYFFIIIISNNWH